MNENNQGQRPRQSNRSRQLIFILIIYLLLVTSSRFGSRSQENATEKLNTLLRAGALPSVSQLFGIFEYGKNYVGKWQKIRFPTSPSSADKDKQAQQISNLPEFQNSGKGKISFSSYTQSNINFVLNLENGQYTDDGNMYAGFSLKNSVRSQLNVLKSDLGQPKSALLQYRVTQQSVNPQAQPTPGPTTNYKIQQIFSNIAIDSTNILGVTFNFTLNEVRNEILVSSTIRTEKFSVFLEIHQVQSTFFRTVIFALIMFIVAYFSFSSVMHILRKIIEGSESPERYSMITVLTTIMWDSVLCLVCFIQAFANEENLILFIMPSFMLCILFTNLELRWMLSIFQSRNVAGDIRSIICRFNLISYGSLLLVYPILLFTNLNYGFFIAICLIFLPQIYVNAEKGIRPNLNHVYYSKFLMLRFIIIFYAKGFPYNIFELKPDYLLCIICLSLVLLQYCLLWAQRVYGPKKIMPSFILPPAFNYKFEEEINIELGQGEIAQCAICLTSLNVDPYDNQGENIMNNQYDKVKVMQTPCKHRYHSRCLIDWMNIKKECPQCRQSLPAFE